MYMARVFPLLLSLSLILSRKRATRKGITVFFCTCRLQGKCRRKKKRQSFKLPSSMQQEHDDCSNSCAQLLVASLSASPSLTLLMSVQCSQLSPLASGALNMLNMVTLKLADRQAHTPTRTERGRETYTHTHTERV